MSAPATKINHLQSYQESRQSTGLWDAFWRVILHPVAFFRSLPATTDTRHWLFMAIMLLAVTSYSAIRYEVLQTQATDSPIDAPLPGDPMPGDPFMDGGMIDPGMPPMGGVPGDGSGTSPNATVDQASSANWEIALMTGSSLIIWWLLLAILLSEASLINGRKPDLGRNFQIAIWSSVPLGLMAGLQVIYYIKTAQTGVAGIAGFLPEWSFYQAQNEATRQLLWSAASRLTIFWLWSLALIYIGARHGLKGRRLAAVLVVITWMMLVITLPVLLGTIELPETAVAQDEMPLIEPGMVDPDMMEPGMIQPGDALPMDDLPSEGAPAPVQEDYQP